MNPVIISTEAESEAQLLLLSPNLLLEILSSSFFQILPGDFFVAEM